MTNQQRFALSGGLPVVVQERPGPALLAARLVLRGGSSADPQHQRGAHQLLAGLMTRGCGSLDAEALADCVEGRGASLRAEASEDALMVGLHCAAEDADVLLPLLLEMVRRPRLEADQVALERQLNLQTLRRQREDPFQLAHDGLRSLLYGNGPYGHDPLGVEAELAALKGPDLQSLVTGLGAQGAVLVLCGTVPTDLQRLLETPLRHSPWTTALPPSRAGASEPDAAIRGSIELQEQDTEQLVLMLGTPTLPLGHPDGPALRLLQTHLGAGMSARLFQVMREERGLAYDVGVHMPARSGAAPFVMHLSSSADRAEEASHCLLDEWNRLLEQSLSPAEMELAQAKFRGQDAMGRQTCSQIAERLSLVLSHGLAENHVERTLEQASRLTPDDLLEAAGRWLRHPSLSLVGPAEGLDPAAALWSDHPLSQGAGQD
ncbi:MAG: pitrilysin family protein [Cyanobacteria bacterium]|nr:pitrilysin family protein [Cyanobacteriota bacterium]